MSAVGKSNISTSCEPPALFLWAFPRCVLPGTATDRGEQAEQWGVQKTASSSLYGGVFSWGGLQCWVWWVMTTCSSGALPHTRGTGAPQHSRENFGKLVDRWERSLNMHREQGRWLLFKALLPAAASRLPGILMPQQLWERGLQMTQRWRCA